MSDVRPILPKRLIITIVCFHICAAALVVFGVAVYAFFRPLMNNILQTQPTDDIFKQLLPAMKIGMLEYTLAFAGIAVGLELIIAALRKCRHWAWVVGIIMSVLIILSGIGNLIGFVLGGLSLWGLVDPKTVVAFRPMMDSNKITDN